MREEANFEELDLDGVVLKHFCLFLGISFRHSWKRQWNSGFHKTAI